MNRAIELVGTPQGDFSAIALADWVQFTSLPPEQYPRSIGYEVMSQLLTDIRVFRAVFDVLRGGPDAVSAYAGSGNRAAADGHQGSDEGMMGAQSSGGGALGL